MSVFKTLKEKKDYYYRCSQCGNGDWYAIELPAHLSQCTHVENCRKCTGKLMLEGVKPKGSAA